MLAPIPGDDRRSYLFWGTRPERELWLTSLALHRDSLKVFGFLPRQQSQSVDQVPTLQAPMKPVLTISALAAILLAACVHVETTPAPRTLASPGERTRLVMLGTGTPNADPARSGPSLAIVVDDTAYLVDSGPGVVRRAAEAAERGVDAMRVENLRHVFLTHLHSDHTLGLPDLIFTPWVLERDEPLQVFGPPGTRAMSDHLTAAWSEDTELRLNGLEPANSRGYLTEVHELEPGLVYEDELVKVHAFRVPHGSWTHSFGFRFETPDRVIVISGDTTPSDELVRAAKDCDTLVHEVYSAVTYNDRPDVWKKYHAVFHTSTVELAAIASQIQPRLLVLTHQLFWGQSEEGLLTEIRDLYDGEVISARDLDIL